MSKDYKNLLADLSTPIDILPNSSNVNINIAIVNANGDESTLSLAASYLYVNTNIIEKPLIFPMIYQF